MDTMEHAFREEMLKRKSSDSKSLLMIKEECFFKDEYFLVKVKRRVFFGQSCISHCKEIQQAVLHPWQLCEQSLLVQLLELESLLHYLDSGKINVLYKTIISSLIVYSLRAYEVLGFLGSTRPSGSGRAGWVLTRRNRSGRLGWSTK